MRASQYNEARVAIRMEEARAENDARGVVRFEDLPPEPDARFAIRTCACGCGLTYPAYSGHGREGQYASRLCRHNANNRVSRKRSAVPPPEPRTETCRCGCGRTWTREHRRARAYATERCRWRDSARRIAEAKRAGTWVPRAPRPPVRCRACRGPIGRDSAGRGVEVVYCLNRVACGWDAVVRAGNGCGKEK